MIKKILKNEEGQSLIEIIIALSIGAILIGAASTAIVVVLNSSSTSQIQQQSTVMAQDMNERIRSFSDANWNNLNSLEKGPDNPYYFTASSTDIITVKGKEGVISGDIKRGLVSYWKLDEVEGTTAYDYAGSNAGNINGATAAVTENCTVGGCLEFISSNSEYIDLGDNDYNYSNFTVSLWAKSPTNNSLDPEFPIHVTNLIGKGNWNNTDEFWYLGYVGSGTSPANRIAFKYYGGSWSSGPSISVNNFDLSEWNHFVGVSTPTEERLYLNGSLIDTNVRSYAGINNTYDMQISRSSYSDRYFDGLVDEVRIYDRSLSAEEIRSIYNSSIFRRYFHVEDACRTNDSNSAIDGAVPCDVGSVQDPDTLQVTTVVEWDTRSGVESFELVDYVTRWRNRVYRQTDWSGGGGEEGPFTGSTNSYSTSTDIELGTGFFQLDLPE